MDYDRLDAILKERGISRRKLALELGINENKMSTAFKRHSGLTVNEVILIADYLSVDYYYLEGWNLEPDESGNLRYVKEGMVIAPGYHDPRQVTPEEKNRSIRRFEEFVEFDETGKRRSEMNQDFNKLNKTGQVEAVKRVKELTEISRYTKQDEQGDSNGQG